MRGGVVALLALIAAFAGPIRLACGTSCVDRPAPMKAALAPAPETSCHKPEHQPEPGHEPSPDHCRHDHSSSIRPGPRVLVQDTTLEPAILQTSTESSWTRIQLVASLTQSQQPPAWPPIRIVPLRI